MQLQTEWKLESSIARMSFFFLENELDKSEISDAGSIWTDEDEDLPSSESTHGKNMRLCITVQPDKQT